jgi:hypothetical protein
MRLLIGGALARPIDVRFDASRESLYLLDFGHFEMHAERGVEVIAHSGKLWRLRLRPDADSPLSFVRRARQWQKGTVR